MTTTVRSSKFRHVVGTPFQLRDTYGDIQPGQPHAESMIISANAHYFALPWGKRGSVCVVPLARTGTVAEETPLIYYSNQEGDKEQINEVNVSPNNDELILTAGNDGGLAVWTVPLEGLTHDINDPTIRIQASDKRMLIAEWHPLASGVILGSAADKSVKLFDLEAGGSEVVSLPDAHKGLLTNVSWNGDGSLLGTCCKDKYLRVFDPRASELVAEVLDHPSPKSTHMAWLGNLDKIVTAGFDKGSERNLHVYDPRNLSQKLSVQKLPASSSVMHIIADEDTNVLFVAGKGDGNLLMFEAVDQAPFLYELNEYKSKTPQNGICLLPKRVLNVMNCEIARFLKLSGNRVEPIRFEVPRAQSQFFQDDLFPDTWDHQPSMSASEWFSGANNQRNYMSLAPQ